MKILKYAAALALSAFALPQAMACFTVYNRTNEVAYSGMEPPIDMSYQIHERLPAVFPGGHMVFGSSTDCPAIDVRKTAPELGNVAFVPVAARRAPVVRMTRAQRERAQDALTK